MARKNKFKPTQYRNITVVRNASNKEEFFANFTVHGVTYQKKNLTKLYDCRTAFQADQKLEEIKADIRKGNNPFTQPRRGQKVEDIVLESIKARKPINPNKDNSRYKKSLEQFYYNYIHDHIGHLYIDKVTRAHAEAILSSLEEFTKSFRLTLNVLMFKVFEKQFRAGKIKSNPFYELNYGTHQPKASFDIRFNEPMEDIAKKLFKSALEFNISHRLLFLMNITTVRRIGELHQLKYSHINQYSNGDWYAIATSDITKTGIEEKYPLPSEVVELLPENILDEEYQDRPLFSFCYSGMFIKFHKLLKNANLNLNKGHKMTPHDNRNLFISILSDRGVNSDLADRCLSHNNTKEIKNVYLEVPFAQRKNIFEQWWEFLRSNN